MKQVALLMKMNKCIFYELCVNRRFPSVWNSTFKITKLVWTFCFYPLSTSYFILLPPSPIKWTEYLISLFKFWWWMDKVSSTILIDGTICNFAFLELCLQNWLRSLHSYFWHSGQISLSEPLMSKYLREEN